MKRAIGIRISVIASSLIILAIACNGISKKQVELEEKTETVTKESQWTQDQEDVKSTVEHFLVVGGNYDLDAMDEMILDKANIGISRLDEGHWVNSTITIAEYFEKAKQIKLKPYYEPVREWDIKINKGQLAFAKADAILHSIGVPRRHNVDYFTLIKENDNWRFLNLSFTSTSLPEDEKIFNLESFAKSYAQVWSGVRPEFVAMFFEEYGSLQVNDGDPALGREAISNVAKEFMTRFPDMTVRFDSLAHKINGIEFHWTLTGTDADPKGEGHKVMVSGYELWIFSERNLIKDSKGNFPSEEYNRQLKFGINQ